MPAPGRERTVEPATDPPGALAHDPQADVVGRIVARAPGVEAAAVVAHCERVVRTARQLDLDARRAGVLAHVRDGLLQDVHHLQLVVGRERHRRADGFQLGAHAGLALEAGEQRPDPVLEVAFRDARAEVDEQLAHVGVGFPHSGLDFVEDARRLVVVPDAHRLAQHLRLQVEERERLRDRVVQLLREQVALLGDGELALARGEPQRSRWPRRGAAPSVASMCRSSVVVARASR